MLASLLSPSLRLAGPWLLGLGPTFIFPTPTNANLGQRKWQVGPGAVIGYLDEHFIVEAFLQQWFSVAGPGSKDIPVNSTCSTLPITFFRGAGWSAGTSPNMLVDWEARSGNMVTFPVGLSVAKVQRFGRLPIRFQVQGQYMPVSADLFGQR